MFNIYNYVSYLIVLNNHHILFYLKYLSINFEIMRNLYEYHFDH
jgi:hypothetical protein